MRLNKRKKKINIERVKFTQQRPSRRLSCVSCKISYNVILKSTRNCSLVIRLGSMPRVCMFSNGFVLFCF